MSADFLHTLLTLPGAFAHCGQLVWLWSALLRPGSTLGLADFGAKYGPQTTTTSYFDSFNRSISDIKSTSDSGNVTLSLGGAGNVIESILPLLIAALALLGGLYLIRK